jgi:mono/diheme cytochrome c family protein
MNALRLVCCLLVGWMASARPLELLDERSTEGDLEVVGEFTGGRTNGFIARAQLLTLPLVIVTNQHDLELQRRLVYTGIPLNDLFGQLPLAPGLDVVTAVCQDKYAAVYPSDYRQRHQPLLVLKLDGKDYADWPTAPSGARMSPFYISYGKFVADSKRTAAGVEEEARIPFAVAKLRFARFADTLGQLQVANAAEAARDGETIALGKCLACHFSGNTGGRLSGKPWLVLAAWAKAEPDLFQKYIRNPRQVEPTSRMPGFPDFQPPALNSLQKYFSAYLVQTVGEP